MPRGTEGRTTVNSRPYRQEPERGVQFESERRDGQEWMLPPMIDKIMNDRWNAGWELARVFSTGGLAYILLWRRRDG